MITARTLHFKKEKKAEVGLFVDLAEGVFCDINEFCTENSIELIQVVQPDPLRKPEYMIGVFKDNFEKKR